MAQCYLQQQDYDQAIVTLEKLTALDERNTGYQKCLAEAYEMAGEHDLARDVYRLLTQIAPEKTEFMTRLALVQIRLKEDDRAQKTLETLFRVNPGHVEGHRILGDLYAGRGQYKEAIEEYRRTLMINENCVDCYAGLALVYRRLENHAEEQAALKKTVELGRETAENLLRLGQLERKLKLPTSIDRFRRVTEVAPETSCAREAEYYLRHKAA
jgi:tetratricopeptide (TPR) repeat protein